MDGNATPRVRRITPAAIVLEFCDGKFTDDDLNDEGNRFAQDDFDSEHGEYIADHEDVLGKDVADLYLIENSWADFDKLKPLLDQRFREWKAGND